VNLTLAIETTRRQYHERILELLPSSALTNQQISDAVGCRRGSVCNLSRQNGIIRPLGYPRKVVHKDGK
jgi:hypothetical protein